MYGIAIMLALLHAVSGNNLENRIGGQRVQNRAIPVRLYLESRRQIPGFRATYVPQCHGTLVLTDVALATGHCVNNIIDRNCVSLRVRNTVYRTADDVRDVKDIIVHSGFQHHVRGTYSNDAAIITLKNEFEVPPACLLSLQPIHPSIALQYPLESFVSGKGIAPGETNGRWMQELPVQIESPRTCKNELTSRGITYTEDMLCSIDRANMVRIDSVRDGEPLVYNQWLIGIASFSTTNHPKIHVFGNVFSLLPNFEQFYEEKK